MIVITAMISAIDALTASSKSSNGVRHSHRPDTQIHVYSDSRSGSVVHRFPPLKDGSPRSLMPDSDLFFVANSDRDVVLARDLNAADVGKSFEFLVVETSIDSSSRYRVDDIRISVVDALDRVSFSRPEYTGRVPENKPAGTGVLINPPPTLCLRNENGLLDPSQMEFVLRRQQEDEDDGDEGKDLGVALVPIEQQDFDEIDEFESSRKIGSNCLKFEILATKMFDYEKEKEISLILEAQDDLDELIASAKIRVEILNENDNLPIFDHPFFDFEFVPLTARYPVVGAVTASDADGDALSYVSLDHDPCCVVVPQNGQVIAVKEIFNETVLRVGVHEKNNRARIARQPALIVIHRVKNALLDGEVLLKRDKRRVTRAVRPTKRIEFTEADGEPEGKIVFQLEKESEHETFRIRDENPWVTVEPNGSVRVKKKWDYEELGREKTIDFWVVISNSGTAGT